MILRIDGDGAGDVARIFKVRDDGNGHPRLEIVVWARARIEMDFVCLMVDGGNQGQQPGAQVEMNHLPGEGIAGARQGENRDLPRDIVTVAFGIELDANQRTGSQGARRNAMVILKELRGGSQAYSRRRRGERVAERQLVRFIPQHNSLTLSGGRRGAEANGSSEDRAAIQNGIEIDALARLQVGDGHLFAAPVNPGAWIKKRAHMAATKDVHGQPVADPVQALESATDQAGVSCG